MDLRLLGPLEARLDDGPIELGPRKQRAVLAMLALEVGHAVSVDRLVEGLWGETPPSSAPKMVQLYVSRLRRVLDGNGGRIVTRGRGYELQLPEEAVDAVRFERLLDTRPRERSRCGAARRSPISPTSRSRRRRSGAWRSCGCARPSWPSTPISPPVATPR